MEGKYYERFKNTASRLWVMLGELLLIISLLIFEWEVSILARVRLKEEFYDTFLRRSIYT